jgi:hypothetical protein
MIFVARTLSFSKSKNNCKRTLEIG